MFFYRKKTVRNNGQNNNIKIPNLKKFFVTINGNNNKVFIEQNATELRGRLGIYGNNNTVIIHKGYDKNLSIDIGFNKDKLVNETYVRIGKDLYCGKTHIVLAENNSSVTIGNDCMFSDNIEIYCTDGHTILNKKGQVTNIGKSVRIGNHVWIGMDVKIGKNTLISDNNVVGWNSVVTKKFMQEHCIIAGNPAKIVKEDITWNRKKTDEMLEMKI